jgi:hypothetical protein
MKTENSFLGEIEVAGRGALVASSQASLEEEQEQ